MIEKESTAEMIEQGDIFFFYRPKIGIDEVEGIEDVQRFYIVTSSLRGKEIQKIFIKNFYLQNIQLKQEVSVDLQQPHRLEKVNTRLLNMIDIQN